MATISSQQFFSQPGETQVVGNEAHIQQEEKQTGQPSTFSNLLTSLRSRAQDVGNQVKNVYDTATDTNISPAERAVGAVAEAGRTPLKVAGALGGAVGDVVGAGLEATGANKAIGSAVEATGASDALTKASQQWKEFSQKNPELASSLGDVGNLLNLEGLGAVGGAGKSAIKTGVETVANAPAKITRYATDAAEQSVKNDITDLLGTRGMTSAVQTAQNKGVDLHQILSDPQVFEGIKVANKRINPDEAISTLEDRINTLMDSKSNILPEVDRLSPDITKDDIFKRAAEYLKSGSGIETATVKENLAHLQKEVDALPDTMKPSVVDKLRADFRKEGRDAKGVMKPDNVYAALEKATRDSIFDATDNLPVANAGDYKAINDYIKSMIGASDFLEKNLRNQPVKGGFVRNVAARTIGAVAGSKFGILGSILGSEGGGAIADIITNNSLGSSMKMRLIKNITDDPKIIEEAEKLLGQLRDTNAPGLPAAGESGFKPATMYAGEKGITPDLQEAVSAKEVPKPGFSTGAVPQTANPLLEEAKKYKSAEEFVNKEPSYFHATKAENVSSIEKQGFSGKVGDMSKASGGNMQEGVFLYPEKSSAEVFGKNFNNPSILETKVNGKIYDANTNTKYGWEDNLQTQEIAKDPKIINQLKKDGYVGVKSTELGTDAVFVFDKNAVKTKSQLTDIYNQAKNEGTTPRLPALIPVQQDNKNKPIDPPADWKFAIQDAYSRYPDLPKGSLETALMMESSMGTDTRNMNKDFGKFGYLGGLTKNGHFVDTLKNIKNPKLKDKIAIADIPGIDKLDTPYAAINAVASSLAKVIRNNPDMDIVDAYFKKYVTAKGSDSLSRRKAFRDYIEHYANALESQESPSKTPQK